MMIRNLAITFLGLLSIRAFPEDALANEAFLRLPLRVHLVKGVEMVRVADKTRTVMDMPVTEEDMRGIIKQVNEIWEPARIRWETDPAKGGGGIVTEQAGGGKLTKEKLADLAEQVVARNREDSGDHMRKVFPSLADPANNETLAGDEKIKAAIYHIYLFPYVGQKLQGTARCPGTFAVVGAYSDKSPNKPGFPKLRPFRFPTKPNDADAAAKFPADGALSSTIAHELGHNLSLTHSDEGMNDNLMKGRVKLRLSQRQIEQARKQAASGPLIR